MIGKRKKKERKPTAKLFALGGNAKKPTSMTSAKVFVLHTNAMNSFI